MSDKMCVRLWPVNPRQGRELVNYTYKGQTYKGGLRPQWYICSAAMAQELGAIRADMSNPTSPTFFQVLPEFEKLRVEQEENLQFLAQLGMVHGAVAIPGDIQGPATSVIREAPVSNEPAEPAGRAAALPPPRQPTQAETATASTVGPIVSADFKPEVAIPIPPPPAQMPELDESGEKADDGEMDAADDGEMDAADAFDAEAVAEELGPVTTRRPGRGFSDDNA